MSPVIKIKHGIVNAKQDKRFYSAVHRWIRTNYGSADHCDMGNCEGLSKKYQWAKLKGKPHGHDRKNYIQMCVICHRNYDAPPIKVSASDRRKIESHITWCPRGHKLDVENTRLVKTEYGCRFAKRCKRCIIINKRNWRKRKARDDVREFIRNRNK